jgi:hypothetical protein
MCYIGTVMWSAGFDWQLVVYLAWTTLWSWGAGSLELSPHHAKWVSAAYTI